MVKAALALTLLAGCFWCTYGRQALTHVEVLTGVARKGADLVTSDRLTAETMPELTYPLERGQAFVRRAKARAGTDPPPSLVKLEELVARYRDFIDTLDRFRRDHSPSEAQAALAEKLAQLEEAANAVRAALAAEKRI